MQKEEAIIDDWDHAFGYSSITINQHNISFYEGLARIYHVSGGSTETYIMSVNRINYQSWRLEVTDIGSLQIGDRLVQ